MSTFRNVCPHTPLSWIENSVLSFLVSKTLKESIVAAFPKVCSSKTTSYKIMMVFIPVLPLDRNKDADVENGLEDMERGKGKLGRSERVASTYIHYQV